MDAMGYIDINHRFYAIYVCKVSSPEHRWVWMNIHRVLQVTNVTNHEIFEWPCCFFGGNDRQQKEVDILDFRWIHSTGILTHIFTIKNQPGYNSLKVHTSSFSAFINGQTCLHLLSNSTITVRICAIHGAYVLHYYWCTKIQNMENVTDVLQVQVSE